MLERFHQTLKSLLHGYCVELDQDWEEWLLWLLLASPKAVLENLGFSLDKPVFGHMVRGPLALLHDPVAQYETLANFESLFGHLANERCTELSALTNDYLCLFNDFSNLHTFIKDCG